MPCACGCSAFAAFHASLIRLEYRGTLGSVIVGAASPFEGSFLSWGVGIVNGGEKPQRVRAGLGCISELRDHQRMPDRRRGHRLSVNMM